MILQGRGRVFNIFYGHLGVKYDLNHDKRRLSAISPEGRKYGPISFDVDKIFKSLCEEYAEQSVLTFNVTEEYDSKGEPKVTLNSFAKINA